MKTPEQLKDLKKNGLGILYLGVETGDEKLLKKIRKGSSPQHLINMGDESVQSFAYQLPVNV